MSDVPDSPPIILPPDIFPPEIAQVTAPLLFGIVLAWTLYGMLVVQVYIYHICFKDRRLFQVFVYSVFFLDTLQTTFMGADLFHWFGTGYGNIRHIADVYFSFFDTPILSSLIALLIHSFFCYRIWILSKLIILPISIILISISSLVGAWISAIWGHSIGNPALVMSNLSNAPIYLWLAGTAIADLAIAVAMTYLLLRAKGLSNRTNAVIQRVVILTMETNAISAILALIALILFFAFMNSNYFIAPIYVLGKCYSNSLLVVLNNRFFLASHTNSSDLPSKPSTGASTSRSNGVVSTIRTPAVSYAAQLPDGGISESPVYKYPWSRGGDPTDSIEIHERKGSRINGDYNHV